MKSKVEKLAERMRELGHPVVISSFRRTRAGRHQRASGAWLWSFNGAKPCREYGSLWSVTDLLKAPRLTIAQVHAGLNDWEVFPE